MDFKTPKNIISAKGYFWLTGLLSLVWLYLYIQSNPAWVQSIKEQLGVSPVLEAKKDSFYNSRINPIFEKYCVACHDGNKDKGQLRLDSYRHLSFSGRSEADLTSSANNLLIERMSLPADDRMAMPPYGRERHSESELELIKLWLSKGGSGVLTENDFPDAPKKAKVITFAEIDWHQIDQSREPLKEYLSLLQAAYPNVLHYQARTSHLIVLDGFAVQNKLTDKVLKEFMPLASAITELNLSGTSISDGALETILLMPQLTKLNISATQITHSRLSDLLSLPNLQSIIIDNYLIDNELMQQFNQQKIKLISVNKE